jgi:mycothiol synthase
MTQPISFRNYHPEDLKAIVVLINESDAVDKMGRATSLAELEQVMFVPTQHPETDCFLALDSDRLVGYAFLYVRPGEGQADSAIYCWGMVHPCWRRRGLGHRLLERAYQRATGYLTELGSGAVTFQCDCWNREQDRKALFEGFGLKPMRYWVNLVRTLDDGLPPVMLPAGIRLRTFDPGRDLETVLHVDNAAFRNHWNHVDASLAEFQPRVESPHFRPELWFLAEEAGGEVVGLALNEINSERSARTGRQEGYIYSLAVLRAYRRQGLGTALLAQSLHALKQAGMEVAELGADTENLTGAMRIYERMGFRVRRKGIAYQKVMRGT